MPSNSEMILQQKSKQQTSSKRASNEQRRAIKMLAKPKAKTQVLKPQTTYWLSLLEAPASPLAPSALRGGVGGGGPPPAAG